MININRWKLFAKFFNHKDIELHSVNIIVFLDFHFTNFDLKNIFYIYILYILYIYYTIILYYIYFILYIIYYIII